MTGLALAVALSTASYPSAYRAVCRDLQQRAAAEAAVICERCLTLDPAAKDCVLKGGRKLKGAKAVPAPTVVLPPEPGAPPQSELADACTQSYLQGKDAKAQETCKRCLEAEAGNKVCSAALKLAEDRLAVALMPLRRRRRAATFNAEQHYLSGVVFFQEDEFLKAKQDWQLCLKLEPARADCQAGVERLDRMGVK